MKKRSKRENPSQEEAIIPAELDIAGMIEKILEGLVSLETKLDTLINRPSQPQSSPCTSRFAPVHGKPSFDRPNRHGRDSRDSRGGDSRQGSGFRDRNFYQVVCAECGQNCEVPFKPSGDRPVYCKDCFSKRKDSSNSGAMFKGRRDSRERDRFVEREFTHDRAARKPFGGRPSASPRGERKKRA